MLQYMNLEMLGEKILDGFLKEINYLQENKHIGDQDYIKTKIDYSFGMERVEYHCAKCGAHHGHVFNDGPKESGKRFCNNGLCLIFKPE